MCLSENTLIRQCEYDERNFNWKKTSIHELENLYNQMKANQVVANRDDVKMYLKNNNLKKHYEDIPYFVEKLLDHSTTKLCTDWEIIWDCGKRKHIILSLYKLLWKRLPHNIKYCVNPNKVAICLWLFSQGTLDKPASTNYKDQIIFYYIQYGLTTYHKARIIQRYWRLYKKATYV